MKKFLTLATLFAVLSCGTAHAASTLATSNVVISKKVVGSLGVAGQVRAGHVLMADSFPSAVLGVDKLAFWNLTSASDSSSETSCAGQTACTLTNNGSIPFNGANMAPFSGLVSNIAVLTGASSQSFSSTDPFLDPGNVNFTLGGWFYSADWQTTYQCLFAQGDSSGNRSFTLCVTGATFDFAASANGTTWTSNIAPVLFFPDATPEWHHIAVRFTSSSVMELFIDGRSVASMYVGALANATTDNFRIGSIASSNYFTGKVSDFFFVKNYVFTDSDISKLASYRIDHNLNIPVQNQNWLATLYRGSSIGPSVTIPENYFVIDKALNTLWFNFWDASTTDQVHVRMRNVAQ